MSDASRVATAGGWNFGDLLIAVESALPAEAPALVQGGERLAWGEFARRSNNLACAMLASGAQAGDKIAFYLRNRPEYLVGVSAAFKARLVHVNVNYRYTGEELHYVLENSDARFVVFEHVFAKEVGRLARRLPNVARWLQVGGQGISFGASFAHWCDEGAGVPPRAARSPDDLLFIYTGGTTGRPKAVMWRHRDLWSALGAGAAIRANRGTAPRDLASHVSNVAGSRLRPVQIPACPLMHGTGLLTSLLNLFAGGCSVLLERPSFDAAELFDTLERERVSSVVIVGDAFARPMLEALETHPDRWDLSSLKLVLSSGVMWSRELKQALLRHLGDVHLVDNYASSEAVGTGASVTTSRAEAATASFRISDTCRVFSEDHREIAPGSGERGLVARTGPIPLGYYKDPEKTARTFPTIDGVRYVILGDWCTVESDGTIRLLGRGSTCINSAGEKIHPEEVEEALKLHPDVRDALVVGVPDSRWGQAVTAVVQLRPGVSLDEVALRSHVRERLAGYKVPKRILAVASLFRGPNGKPDYASAASHAASLLARGG